MFIEGMEILSPLSLQQVVYYQPLEEEVATLKITMHFLTLSQSMVYVE